MLNVIRHDYYNLSSRVADKKKGISEGELKKLKSHIDNGDEELDNSALESFRKKIIDELGCKSSSTDEKRPFRNNTDARRTLTNSRFSAPTRQFQRGGFRTYSNDQRRNHFNNRGSGNRSFFMEKSRNITNRQREK